MKHRRSHFTLYILHFTLLFAAAFSCAAKTLSWRASPEPSSATFAAYHGETVEFRPVASNVVFSSVYYQTNGMGQAWWQTDGLVFHPTNDIGAAAYRFFVAGHDATGRDWRANGLLRMLDSPGFEPNVLAPPVVTLDFATMDVLNAPYYLKSEVDDLIGQGSVPGDYAVVSNAAVHAAITNALQDAELAGKLDKSGGTVNGDLTVTNQLYANYIYPTNGDQSPQWFGDSSAIHCENRDGVRFTSGDTRVAWLDELNSAVQQIAPAFSAKTYVKNALCTYNGVVYRCMMGYTATALSATPDADDTHWLARKVSDLFLLKDGDSALFLGDTDGEFFFADNAEIGLLDNREGSSTRTIVIQKGAIYLDHYNTTLSFPTTSGTLALDADIAAATNATLAAAKDYTDAHAGPADALTLTSPSGIVWTVGVNNDGTIYTYIEE